MNEREFRRRFPNASEACVANNCEVLPAKSRKQAPALEREAQGEKESTERTLVRITCARSRKLDRDNLYASCKDVIDSLVIAGLIQDDSEDFIDLRITQELVKRGEAPHAVIEIQYP